jgi:putative ABC transport system ATP-binding protein
VCVHGESGSGKTTLLNLVAGILPVDEGTVEVMGEPLHGRGELARDRVRARHVGYVFQTFNLLPHLTAFENVALGMAFRPAGDAGPRAAARDALVRVGLGDRLHHSTAQLSVGQRQRVAIARALAGRPGLVLADEPTANLDPARGRASLDLLLAFAAERNAAVLLVTHDTAVLERFADHVVLRAPAPTSAAARGDA